ncbi:MAG: signal peptidase I [Lachnospiraceae bacterium]|nr:signal peptidase I [Lachnospiraceae bacterium]
MTQKEPEDGASGEKRDAMWYIKEIMPYVLIIIAALFLNTFIIINARIPSGSMETTIMTGERVFGSRLAYRNSDPERYEIVIFHYPDDESLLFVKRVIGLPGDTIELRGGQVYINGVNDMENESFVSSDLKDDFGPYTVPEGCYFMLGDNRAHSNDSRFWKTKCVSRDKIVGRAGLRYWPLNKIGFINKYAKN